MERHRIATERVAELEKQHSMRRAKDRTLEGFIQGIGIRPLAIEEFDVKLWLTIVDKAKVLPDGRLVFTFKDRTAIET
ncbi:MAG: hypothetical protein ACOYIB_03685 [Desulfosporosinus sp.]|jgi:hypothetical protein